MHELGIVTHAIKTIQEFADENGIREISAATLRVGEVSGVIHSEFESCWNYFRKKYPATQNAVLKIEVEPAFTWCDGCEKVYRTVEHGRICPYCGSEKTWLLRGRECSVKEIEVPETEQE